LTVNNLKQLDIDPEDIVSIGLTNQVRAHCFHMEVNVAVLNAISQNYNFFEV
jgi:hypothetical protein